MIKVHHIVSVDKGNYYLENLFDYSDRLKLEFSFTTLADEECQFVRRMRERGLKVEALGTTGRRQYPTAYARISRILKDIDPDVVHTHLFDPSLLGLRAARRQDRRTVVTRHHSDALHKIDSLFKRRFYLGLEGLINRWADHIIAPSRMVRDILVKREQVPAEKVSLVPYGQTEDRFNDLDRSRIDFIRRDLKLDGLLSLVCVSRLFHRKGHEDLFEALARFRKIEPNVRLVLVGSGDYESTLRERVDALGLSSEVLFLGWRDDALEVVSACDVVVHPSLEDALSSAVIEAVMLRKPIIATDISGVEDSLGGGKFGTIVAPENPGELFEALVKVSDDLEGACERAAQGKAHILNYMSAKRVSDEYLKIYEGLVDSQ